MTIEEILKSQALTDEQISGITKAMADAKIYTTGEQNIDIRYKKLKDEHDALTAKHTEATTLIDQLKAGTKNSEALQGKISDYETQIAQLNDQLAQTKLESAIKVALLDAKATDVDYMTFKLREKGELELDENGKIKGIDDKIAGLKTQFPTQFETSKRDKEIEVQNLPNANKNKGMTKSEFLRKSYLERAQYAQDNPEGYKALMND